MFPDPHAEFSITSPLAAISSSRFQVNASLTWRSSKCDSGQPPNSSDERLSYATGSPREEVHRDQRGCSVYPWNILNGHAFRSVFHRRLCVSSHFDSKTFAAVHTQQIVIVEDYILQNRLDERQAKILKALFGNIATKQELSANCVRPSRIR